jgi:deoxyribose-phosphate aldolase
VENQKKITALDIAKMIDHSLLRPDMTRQEVIEGCLLAKAYNCATVCVKPCDVEIAYEILKDTEVLTTTVIGFPHGSNLTGVKLKEAEIAIEQGCKEIDMVLNIGRLKSGDDELVEADIKAVCGYAHGKGVIVKVILENAYLTDEQIVRACKLCEKAGADFVKTSTGYAKSGATIPNLKLMRKTCSPKIRIKAAGGVRTIAAALMVRAVGGSRFGATTTAKIVEDAMRMEKEGTLIVPNADSVTELPTA